MDAAVVLVALVLPAFITLLYFIILGQFPASAQQMAYIVGKGIQFVLPVAWVWLFQRQRFLWKWPRADGLIVSVFFGLAVIAAMMWMYHFWLKPVGYMDTSSAVAKGIQQKVLGFGLDSTAKYYGLGAFYSLIHSGLEEYYWRWFVFGQLRLLVRLRASIAISSLGFALHHILLLGTYFGYSSLATWMFSLAITIGGAFWAWLYYRTDSIYAPWISHLIVDAGIFTIGYDMVHHLF